MARRKTSGRTLLIDDAVEIEILEPRKRARRSKGYALTIQGTEWRVHVVSRGSCRALKGCEGACDHEGARIFIAAELSPERRADVFVHELLHALTFASGVDRAVPASMGCDEKKWTEVDETIVRLLAPVLFDTLTRNGLLTIPKGML